MFNSVSLSVFLVIHRPQTENVAWRRAKHLTDFWRLEKERHCRQLSTVVHPHPPIACLFTRARLSEVILSELRSCMHLWLLETGSAWFPDQRQCAVSRNCRAAPRPLGGAVSSMQVKLSPHVLSPFVWSEETPMTSHSRLCWRSYEGLAAFSSIPAVLNLCGLLTRGREGGHLFQSFHISYRY